MLWILQEHARLTFLFEERDRLCTDSLMLPHPPAPPQNSGVCFSDGGARVTGSVCSYGTMQTNCITESENPWPWGPATRLADSQSSPARKYETGILTTKSVLTLEFTCPEERRFCYKCRLIIAGTL